ncbi:nicotinate-nucleotide-dimethylbenzimidazole phosphoribosyltransferase [Sporobacter termitidis DSM 10068]|uniref:Nicotinate-nucleotide--dimethylbenzimidazole phosphoribosyltransferase n=1 Tax=Sporobacter termitidis DSM 10068 TaxID=1123282 RepID=A0A1M5X3F8_9FIRM|nr:nicotinate-nucleotide--dimethylbenzimidazole phosphoribosyltransferase [Sporobacter termitidis]SHH94375.1 nicotinate-nucleotide-dimethylbenzimidazole phosphoribosyltransferase [Sporobacter termitidis DSM 10068]
MNYSELNNQIPKPDAAARARAQAHWDSIAKPLNSLGLLEDAVVTLAGLAGSPNVRLDRRGVLVLCADNGVVREGISQSPSDITLLVAENLTKKQTSVCRMAKVADADVIPVDMGMIKKLSNPLLLDRHIADGTQNIAEGPAMTLQQAEKAIEAGIGLVKDCREQGYDILATGEMGIGNTTTSSAVAAVLLHRPVEEVTGRGAGLSDDALRRKIDVIEKAIHVNRPDPDDALDILMKLGGFDIAGMTGIFIGGALYRVPIIIDGIISAVSALIAARLCPAAKAAMLASHVSEEPAAKMLLDTLDLRPMITAGMRLGEGTGAVTLLPLLDMALAVYHGSSSFSDIGMDAYKPHQ